SVHGPAYGDLLVQRSLADAAERDTEGRARPERHPRGRALRDLAAASARGESMSPADSRPSRAPAALAIALSSLLGTSAISADPASSAASAWLPRPERSGAELDGPLEQRGRDVFDQRCAACHGEVPDEIYGPQFLPPMPGTQVLEA